MQENTVPDPRRASVVHGKSQQHVWRAVGGPALASCVALWAAQPPLGWSVLAWLAPLGLISLIDRPASPGRQGYFILWLAGCVYWLAILQGIRLAFWPLYFGWLALSLYLAIYVPLFVAIARNLTTYWKVPLVWAAPIAWTGLELWRSYLLTGYAASTLAHSQYLNPLVLQLADQLGGYGVSFIMLATSVAIYRLVQGSVARAQPRPLSDLVVAGCWLTLLLGYGAYRTSEGDRLEESGQPLLTAALIQENTPSMFDADPDRLLKAWTRYAGKSAEAWKSHPHIDVIIWPESTYTAMIPWTEDHTVRDIPKELKDLNYDRYALRDKVADLQQQFQRKTRQLQDNLRQVQAAVALADPPGAASPGQVVPAAAIGSDASTASLPHLLVGNDVMDMHDTKVDRFNAALLIDPAGQIVNRYEKMHLVMFGEYIPLGWALKFLGDAFGLAPTDAGTTARAFEIGQVVLAPSICFESMMPQTMAWQLRSLKAMDKDPDLLVNVTNDSWFRGSSMLDHHLACEVLSAIELRRPFIIAANTGITAWIAGSGRIIERLERLQPGYIIAQPKRDSRWGLTQLWGDLPAWCLAIICFVSPLLTFGCGRSKRAY